MANKSLGQHWLQDKLSLEAMCDAADVVSGDVVLEIGPGHGTLTERLLKRGALVTAIEIDEDLASRLEKKFSNYSNFNLISGDVLKFDFGTLPPKYKIVANIPYYLTSHLLRLLTDTLNKPQKAVVLLQKEVAERVAATPGKHSILSIAVQSQAQVTLDREVAAELFSPPPKVDSQILILDFLDNPTIEDLAGLMKIVKAGFSSPRKKLRSSLAGGLRISTENAESLLNMANIDSSRRAQTLTLEEWVNLYIISKSINL